MVEDEDEEEEEALEAMREKKKIGSVIPC